MKRKVRLGQHFLVSKKALNTAVKAAQIKSTDAILEVGPGRGALTEVLLQKGARVIAVETDRGLIEYLQKRFSDQVENRALTLVSGDILRFSPRKYGLKTGKYKLVANIPYYITGALLRKFLSHREHPSSAVLMLQKEVAKNITADDGKESLVSISVRAYGNPRYIGAVKASSFKPAPKVDSAIVAIDKISRDFFKDISETEFFGVVKAGFSHKRKRLAKNLAPYGSEAVKRAFKGANLGENVRAEDLSLSDWKNLALSLNPL